VIAEKGHVRSHWRQPTHAASFAMAVQETGSIESAPAGQRMTHSWQPAQRSTKTVTWRSARVSVVEMVAVIVSP
jgi:hypothetical protein